MHRRLYLFSAFFFLSVGLFLYADDSEQPEFFRDLRGRTLIIDIDARVLEENHEVVWNEVHSRMTLPGNPVGIKLVGANVVVAVQFTPFIRRRGGNVLVAQGQIWTEIPNEGIRYHTSIQTIPLVFDEPIYFFPLGQNRQMDGSTIEIMLTMKPYRETEPQPGALREGSPPVPASAVNTGDSD
jgi:hypothetical protein